jgi:hypothetical protein
MYREHLDLIFGEHGNPLDGQKETVVDFPVPSGTYLPGNMTNRQAFPEPASSASSASYLSQAMPAPLTPSTLPLLSIESGGFTPSFSWQTLENPSFHGKTIGGKDVPAKRSTRSLGLCPQGKTMRINLNSASIQEDKQTHVHMPTFSEKFGSTDNEQIASRKPSPLDLRHLYYKIEEAAKRGEPVDGLLHELSVVSTRLVKQRREEYETSLRPAPSKQVLRPLSSGKVNITRVPSSHRPIKDVKKLWISEASPTKPERNCGETSSTSGNEGNDRLSSSYASTTDSWATIHEGK